MKTIVATIQRDQNVIIRNEDADVLVIQGVAGSGKTSIALHRVAFLLYRFKDELKARNVLIISPNKVFGDFISNVLPELGEEPIAELEMDGLAQHLLGDRYRFWSFFEQSQALLAGQDDGVRERVQAKSSPGFLRDLDRYIEHVQTTRFTPGDVTVRDYVVQSVLIEYAFQRQGTLPVAASVRDLADSVEYEVRRRLRVELTAKERAAIRTAVKRMFRAAPLRTLYKEFYQWLGRPELFAATRGILEHSDVFPMIYLALRLEGAEAFDADYRQVKHLVVDEMQDYTAVQYAVLARLFPCRKTILGDVSQSLNPWNATTSEEIARVFRSATCLKLTKSYRSSYEIMQFAQAISPDSDLVPVERHGFLPQVRQCPDHAQELEGIRHSMERFALRGFQTMGIVCKTQQQAEQLHQELGQSAQTVHLLSARSSAFVRGVVICCTHLAKGLEFDLVHVPLATSENYCQVLDRNLLYVACTRAMHELHVTHVGQRTSFIPDATLFEAP